MSRALIWWGEWKRKHDSSPRSLLKHDFVLFDWVSVSACSTRSIGLTCVCVCVFVTPTWSHNPLVSLHVFPLRMGQTVDGPDTNADKYEQQGEGGESLSEACAPVLLPNISKKKKKTRRRYFTFHTPSFFPCFSSISLNVNCRVCSKAGVCPPVCLSCLSDDWRSTSPAANMKVVRLL